MIYNNLGTSGGATNFFFTWVIQRTINISRNILKTCQGNPILSPICNSLKRSIVSAASLSSGFQLIAWGHIEKLKTN